MFYLSVKSVLISNMVLVVEYINVSDQCHVKVQHIAELIEQMNMISYNIKSYQFNEIVVIW